jgi:hypothetical protein
VLTTPNRLHALDAVRALALLAGVLLHGTMSFLPGFAPLPTMHLAALAGICALFVGLTVRRLGRAD